MLRFSPTTPVRFFAKDSGYVLGQGEEAAWRDIGMLFCEWRGSYGDRTTAAQALGVSDSATVRTFYHPGIYAKLRESQIIAVKNDATNALIDGVPNTGNPNVYELWGGADNVADKNQFMEFNVRRYEGK